MSRNIRTYLFIFFLLLDLCSGGASLCAAEAAKARQVPKETVERAQRSLDPAAEQELLSDPDYKYDRVEGPEPLSAWDRFWEWLFRKLGKASQTNEGAMGFEALQYILLAGAVVALIILLLKNNIRSLFYGKSASVPVDFKEFEEDIHGIDFEKLIADAISKKDFRKAVRLHFLKLLKELTDKGLIKWQIDKTNNDYSMELASSKYHVQFRELASLYEYVWYGDFQLDEAGFGSTISKFKRFSV